MRINSPCLHCSPACCSHHTLGCTHSRHGLPIPAHPLRQHRGRPCLGLSLSQAALHAARHQLSWSSRQVHICSSVQSSRIPFCSAGPVPRVHPLPPIHLPPPGLASLPAWRSPQPPPPPSGAPACAEMAWVGAHEAVDRSSQQRNSSCCRHGPKIAPCTALSHLLLTGSAVSCTICSTCASAACTRLSSSSASCRADRTGRGCQACLSSISQAVSSCHTPQTGAWPPSPSPRPAGRVPSSPLQPAQRNWC